MEFPYHSTVSYNGVTFYFNERATRAYFICGGCLISIPRKHGGEIAKFGHVVRGVGPGDRSVASYVRSELNRTGKTWAVSSNNNCVFLDRVALLSAGSGAVDRDLCGTFDVEVEDPTLADYLVSLPVTHLTLVAGVDVTRENKLKLFPTPTAINTTNGFMYVPNEASFSLVYMRMLELPEGLQELVSGLFDGTPEIRDALNGSNDDEKTSIIVSRRAADVVTEDVKADDVPISGEPYSEKQPRRRKKSDHITLSNFVQIRTIPRVMDIWDPRHKATTHCIRALSCAVFFADEVIFKARKWPGLEDELNEARETIYTAVVAVYGERGELPFFGHAYGRDLTSCQRFVIVQYILSRWEAFNCYAVIEDLTRSYVNALPSDDDTDRVAQDLIRTIVDTANSLLREVGFIGTLAETLLFLPLPQLPCYKETSHLAKKEGVRILRLAKTGVGLSDTVPVDVSVTERHEYEISRYLDTLYSGDPCYNGAVRLCRLLGSSIPIALYYNTISGNAFEPYFAGRRYIAYLGALFFGRVHQTPFGDGKKTQR